MENGDLERKFEDLNDLNDLKPWNSGKPTWRPGPNRDWFPGMDQQVFRSSTSLLPPGQAKVSFSPGWMLIQSTQIMVSLLLNPHTTASPAAIASSAGRDAGFHGDWTVFHGYSWINTLQKMISSYSGWWYTYPSEKYESVGMIIPIYYGK